MIKKYEKNLKFLTVKTFFLNNILTYLLQIKIIYMKKLSFLMTLSMMLVSFWGFSQQVTITGNVADDNSLALPGATV